jgi:hypothetical protein
MVTLTKFNISDAREAILKLAPVDASAAMTGVPATKTVPKVVEQDKNTANSILNAIMLMGALGEPKYAQMIELIKSDLNSLDVSDIIPRKINPWWCAGMTPISGDASQMTADPMTYLARLNNAIVTAGGIAERASISVATMPFDGTGSITIPGPVVATSVPLTSLGSSLDPVLGWMYRCQANAQLTGGPIFQVDYSSALIGGPSFKFQMDSNIQRGMVFVPHAQQSMQNDTNQALVSPGPGLINCQTVSSDKQVATDKVLSISTESDVSFYGQVISGNNIIVEAYPVVLTVERWFAIVRLILHNQLDLLGPVMVQNAMQSLA